MLVCKHFLSKKDVNFFGLIDTNKYNQFIKANNCEWESALDYLKTEGFVKENLPLTHLRNDSVNAHSGTNLFLLMGAELSIDTGSIKEFHCISMADIVDIVKKDYSAWFKDYLTDIDEYNKDNCEIINNLYKAIFQYKNVDAMELSLFVDSLYERVPENFLEVSEYIFSTLNEYWNIPSVYTHLPKPSRMKGKKAIKIIASSYEFINNKLNITSAKLKSLPKNLEKYVEENDIDKSEPFMKFDSFYDFQNALNDFLRNKNIDENRRKFLLCDFGIINNILDLKTTSEQGEDEPKEKDTVIAVNGDPLSVYLQIILYSCIKFRSKFDNNLPQELELSVKSVNLSNSISSYDNEDDENDGQSSVLPHYLNICSCMGGLAKFINEKALNEKQITLKYVDNIDPFNQNNIDYMNGKIKAIKKWGKDSQIIFSMTAVGNDENEKKTYEFKWSFSPYASWKNSFTLLSEVYNQDLSDKVLPLLIRCNNMTDFLSCESENEFFVKLESMPYSIMNKAYIKNIRQVFGGSSILDKFNLVNISFEKWCDKLFDNGFFNNIDQMNSMIGNYLDFLGCAKQSYQNLTSNQREKAALLLNCFSIISNERFFEDGRISDSIIPSYNPAMLEKINAQNFYSIFSFSELFDSIDDITEKNYQQKLADIRNLAEITQGVDLIPDGSGGSIVCRNVWGNYAVYYTEKTQIPYISNIEPVQNEEEIGSPINESSHSKVIARNISDYLKTFPVRADGLNLCFISPNEIQYVVAGISKAAEEYGKDGNEAVFNIKIICFGGSKNVSGYLRYWLNNYMAKERTVKINAYLNYIQTENITNDLPKMLENQDICFVYDILKTETFKFESYYTNTKDEQDQMQYCQFPMTFIPDTITGTHGQKRKINISQMQFLVSKAYTQLSHKILEPNSVDGEYKVMQQLSLGVHQKNILDIIHNMCRWVVCEDKAIDRDILQTDDKKIIGFTTGEGCFGEYNVTVSAKNTILKDIQKLLKIRLVEKFSSWNNEMAEKAADNCLKLTESFDGSRILKALNPYDYEIHNFLAYALMVKELNICESIKGKFITRNLLNMDSYRHWLKDADEDKRPDFMLVEIPITDDIFDPAVPLRMKIKIIECKMGLHVDNYIEKATIQVNNGIAALSSLWSKNNKHVSRRYWFTQLYRAMAFSRLGIDDSDVNFAVINSKIYGILNGNFEIEWSGDIYAYSLTENNDISQIENLSGNDVISSITLHNAGQLYIQKMLLPNEMQNADLAYSNIPDNAELENEEQNEKFNEEEAYTDEVQITFNDIENFEKQVEIPKPKQILVPFIYYLCSVTDCSRQDALKWFKAYYNFSQLDMNHRYESNGHSKLETVLDFTITELRTKGIIENSTYGIFHITEFGKAVNDEILNKNISEINDELLSKIKNKISDAYKENNQSIGLAKSNDKSTDTSPNDKPARKPVSEVRILLGEDIKTKEKYYWEFGNKELNNRHLLINGNSGCGKTYCIQGLLMETALQGVSSVVFDYTGGFTSSKLDPIFKNALGDRIKQRVIRVDKIPVNPFVKHDIQIDDDLFVPEEDVDVASKIAEIFSTVYSLGDQQKSAIYSAVLSGLEKYKDSMNFRIMVDELEESETSYAKTVISKIQAFTDINPFAVDSSFSWSDIRDSEGMVYVIQLTGYGRDIQILLTELLLWDIWSFSVKNGDESKPLILVLDEAQNLSHGDKSPSAKILTEGRKFGLSGWYATQFMKPQLSDDEIQRLQQAGQKLYFCPPDDGVMAVAKNIDINSQGAKDWSERLKKLKKGECVTCGSMIKNNRWIKYDPKIIKVISLQERLNNEQ